MRVHARFDTEWIAQAIHLHVKVRTLMLKIHRPLLFWYIMHLLMITTLHYLLRYKSIQFQGKSFYKLSITTSSFTQILILLKSSLFFYSLFLLYFICHTSAIKTVTWLNFQPCTILCIDFLLLTQCFFFQSPLSSSWKCQALKFLLLLPSTWTGPLELFTNSVKSF